MVGSRTLAALAGVWTHVYVYQIPPHWDGAARTVASVPVPAGYERAPVAPGSFGAWLRELPLKPGRPQVVLFDGRPKVNQTAHYAVLDVDVGDRDLQQCADAVLVVDVAENAGGERVFMLAQSYMPAQDIHILRSFDDLDPWYRAATRGLLRTPEWNFDYDDLRRFPGTSCELEVHHP
jgi:Domain of unknown function (4846)